jgi:hypothetical protein
VLHKKKAVQSRAVIAAMTDQDASVHLIDRTDVLMSEVAATHLLIAQRVSVAPIETAADARSEVVIGKAAAETVNETANRGQHGSLAKAADASVGLVTTVGLQGGGKNAIGGVVVAEEAAEEMMLARGVAIPRIKAMETRREGVKGAD